MQIVKSLLLEDANNVTKDILSSMEHVDWETHSAEPLTTKGDVQAVTMDTL